MTKDAILEKLSQLPPEVLDKKRDEKLLELRSILSQLYKARDEELILKHRKRKEWIIDNSPNRTEQLLRGDEELYLLKRKVMELSALKNKVKLEIEIITSYFWRSKA